MKAKTKPCYDGPDLDKYLVVRKKRFTTYGTGAGMYSMNYYLVPLKRLPVPVLR